MNLNSSLFQNKTPGIQHSNYHKTVLSSGCLCFLPGSIPKRIMIIIMMNFFQVVYIKPCKCIFWRSKSTKSIMDFPLQGAFMQMHIIAYYSSDDNEPIEPNPPNIFAHWSLEDAISTLHPSYPPLCWISWCYNIHRLIFWIFMLYSCKCM